MALPTLLGDTEALTEADPRGRPLRARLLELTGWLMTRTRQFDSAEMALERALDDATDRIQSAATVNTQCWFLLRRGKLADASAEVTTGAGKPGSLKRWII